MNEPTNLQKFKEEKLNKRIIQDVTKILMILEHCQQALMFFRKYKSVQEIISVLETNKTLLILQKKAYEKSTNIDKNKK